MIYGLFHGRHLSIFARVRLNFSASEMQLNQLNLPQFSHVKIILWLSRKSFIVVLCLLAIIIIYTLSKKTALFSVEHNFRKYMHCSILIILSLLLTEIIRPQIHNWISHFTNSLLLHYLEKCKHTLFHKKMLNKSAMHAVISLLLQSRKFWWYLLLTCSMLLRHVIMT